MNAQPEKQPQDDGLEWLREIRRKISAEHGHDPHRLGAKLREMEKLPQFASRMVRVRKVLEPIPAECP